MGVFIMKALISPQENNRIAEVAVTDFPIAEPLYWLDCPDNCKTDWTYINNQFIEPVIPDPVIVIPTTVSMRQARLALLQVEILNEVNTTIAAGTEADKITWEYATEVNRSDALVTNMSIALNLTEQDLDNLFSLANTL